MVKKKYKEIIFNFLTETRKVEKLLLHIFTVSKKYKHLLIKTEPQCDNRGLKKNEKF